MGGEGGICKTNRNEQGGEGVKILKFRANVLFEWPPIDSFLEAAKMSSQTLMILTKVLRV